MAFVNEHFLQLQGSYLFSEVARKVKAFEAAHPQVRLIRLGIGDVTRPLPQACIEAMCRAVRELADARTFHGYGPEQGYDFLIKAILKHDFEERGITLSPSEIFISDGAKSDLGNLTELSVRIISSPLPIRYIRCMWTVMSCADVRELPERTVCGARSLTCLVPVRTGLFPNFPIIGRSGLPVLSQ